MDYKFNPEAIQEMIDELRDPSKRVRPDFWTPDVAIALLSFAQDRFRSPLRVTAQDICDLLNALLDCAEELDDVVTPNQRWTQMIYYADAMENKRLSFKLVEVN